MGCSLAASSVYCRAVWPSYLLALGTSNMMGGAVFVACCRRSVCVCVSLVQGWQVVVVQVCARLGVFLNVKAVGQLVTSCRLHQDYY